MDVSLKDIIDALGGGTSSIVIIALAWFAWNERKRSNQLADRIAEMAEKASEAMHTLARQIEKATEK